MIEAIEVYQPETVVSNEQLARCFGDWSAEKIHDKTGIRERRVSRPEEFASDLACGAARRLLGRRKGADIDFLLLCTQSPDYLLPSTACLVQHRLGLSTDCGAADINLGCSGYIYGLGIAQGLVHSGLAAQVLLATADTYSKFLDPQDRSTRTIFGDAGSATLLCKQSASRLHSFVFGTDGSGAAHLIMRRGGVRDIAGRPNPEGGDGGAQGDTSSGFLYMNGPEIFNFTIRRVPEVIGKVLAKASLKLEDIDHFVFHQANAFMLEHLRRKLTIPAEKFVLSMERCGNTVSGSIPLALASMLDSGTLVNGGRVLLCGFGVGLSWAGCVLEWGVEKHEGEV